MNLPEKWLLTDTVFIAAISQACCKFFLLVLIRRLSGRGTLTALLVERLPGVLEAGIILLTQYFSVSLTHVTVFCYSAPAIAASRVKQGSREAWLPSYIEKGSGQGG